MESVIAGIGAIPDVAKNVFKSGGVGDPGREFVWAVGVVGAVESEGECAVCREVAVVVRVCVIYGAHY